MTLRTAILAVAGVMTLAWGARAAEPEFVVPPPVMMVAGPAPVGVMADPFWRISQLVARQQAMMTAMMTDMSADMSALRLVALPAMMAGPGQLVVTRVMVAGPSVCRQTVVYRAGADGAPVIEAASRSQGCLVGTVRGHHLAPADTAVKPDQGNGLTVDAQGNRLYSVVDRAPVTAPKPTKF